MADKSVISLIKQLTLQNYLRMTTENIAASVIKVSSHDQGMVMLLHKSLKSTFAPSHIHNRVCEERDWIIKETIIFINFSNLIIDI